MNLYEINQEIINLVDEETGEIIDLERFNELNLDRDTKIENLCLWYKNLVSDAEQIKNEIDLLKERYESKKRQAESKKNFIANILQGNTFETSKTKVAYRKTTKVETDDFFLEWAKEHADDLLKYKEPEISKTAIKEALKTGRQIEHAQIVENQSINIK